jgi:hypothetical protein
MKSQENVVLLDINHTQTDAGKTRFHPKTDICDRQGYSREYAGRPTKMDDSM